MAVDSRFEGSKRRTLSVEAARFYATVYASARKGSLAELRGTGCSEEEAEDFFSTAFQRVMETVDPVSRGFSAPQMVNFIKRAAWHCMIDERRRRGQRVEVELGEVLSLADSSAESPDEVAEEREAAAIGLEALQMLSERDRLIFRQRHQLDLSPEEIVSATPGLSLRTYRKIIQRANTRVLEAYERIEAGARCEEMEGDLLRRYVAEECTEAEIAEVSAHLAHCRACRQTQARMRGYLLDVGAAIAISASVERSTHLWRGLDAPTWVAHGAWDAVRSLAASSKAARERGREMLVRLVGLQGPGSDATIGQALTTTSVKVASACAAAVAAGACVATGVLPAVGGIGLLDHHDSNPQPRPHRHAVIREPAPEKPETSSNVRSPVSHPASRRPHRRDRRVQDKSPVSGGSSSPRQADSNRAAASRPSEAKESGAVTGTEFGAEAGGAGEPISPQPSHTPSSPPASSGSVGNSSAVGQGGSAHKPAEPSSGESEFGF